MLIDLSDYWLLFLLNGGRMWMYFPCFPKCQWTDLTSFVSDPSPQAETDGDKLHCQGNSKMWSKVIFPHFQILMEMGTEIYVHISDILLFMKFIVLMFIFVISWTH